MLLELHILQNFAPANLNRDDSGAPKDAEFGGHRRARVSSQCLKRAIRRAMQKEMPSAEDLAVRTKRVLTALTERLAGEGRDPDQAKAVATAALATLGLAVDKDDKTEYLLFLGQREVDRIADLCHTHWGALLQSGERGEQDHQKKKKKAAQDRATSEVRKAFLDVLTGGNARDLALFGRMLADLPERSIDAASQVAHALSTNRVSMEFDYFTAVDDLKPEETSGADMIGTVEFNSACFYRYANVDVDQLTVNLSGDRHLAIDTVGSFVRACVHAVPTGKQNSMAAQNPPSLVLAVLRKDGACSLTNAFVKPAAPTHDGDLVTASIAKLDDYWNRLMTMYGHEGLVGAWVCTTEPEALRHLSAAAQPPVVQAVSVPELTQLILGSLGSVGAGAAA